MIKNSAGSALKFAPQKPWARPNHPFGSIGHRHYARAVGKNHYLRSVWKIPGGGPSHVPETCFACTRQVGNEDLWRRSRRFLHI